MAEETFAARLREHARQVRGFLDERSDDRTSAPVTFMPFSPEEADALADALEAAEKVYRSYHFGEDDFSDLDPAITVLRDALARLNDRLAVKSAEGQPGS